MEEVKFLVADVETTGTDPKTDKIVELAWVEMTQDLEYVPGSEFSSIVNPERDIPCGAAGIHGIRNSVIEEENPPTIDQIEFPDSPLVLVCHNIPFDVQFLSPHMNVVDTICTLQMSRRLIPGSDNHKLSTLSCYLDLPKQNSHEAMGDVWDCGNLLAFMCSELEWSLDDMLAYSKEDLILETCTVGKKWTGKPWSEVDSGYLRWILSNEFDPDTMNTARYWLKQRRG